MMEVYSNPHQYHGFIPSYNAYDPSTAAPAIGYNGYNGSYLPWPYQIPSQDFNDNENKSSNSVVTTGSAFETYKPQAAFNHQPSVKTERVSPSYHSKCPTSTYSSQNHYTTNFPQPSLAQDQYCNRQQTLPHYNYGVSQQSYSQGHLSYPSVPSAFDGYQIPFTQTKQDNDSTVEEPKKEIKKLPSKRGRRTKKCQCSNCQLPPLPPDEKTGKPQQRKHNCHFAGCNREYGKTSHLKSHIMWHENQRPFQCTFATCDKKFTRSDELSRHIKTHTKEQIHKCTVCGKGFGRSDHRNKHMKIHDKQHSTKPRGRRSKIRDQMKSNTTSSFTNLPTAKVQSENSNVQANRQAAFQVPAISDPYVVNRYDHAPGSYGVCNQYDVFQDCHSGRVMQY